MDCNAMNKITRIANALATYVAYMNARADGCLSVSRLEDEVFGGIDSAESIEFWKDASMNAREVGNNDYMHLLFSLFMAMTDEEIMEIRDSYFKSEEDRINVVRSAV